MYMMKWNVLAVSLASETCCYNVQYLRC